MNVHLYMHISYIYINVCIHLYIQIYLHIYIGLDIIEVYDEDGELVGTYTGAEFDKLKRNK
jgi:hypothetical protein